MKNDRLLMSGKLFLFLLVSLLSWSCKKNKEEELFYTEKDRSIFITEKISVDNGVRIKQPIFNIPNYENFLKYLSSSDHFLLVQLKDFKNASSKDKVILALRYDIDENINAAIKFAYREHKYGIKSTYFILHTANYYGETRLGYFSRNSTLLPYLKKIQNAFNHEIGFHNDLVTLQIVYSIPPKEFLKNELAYLRGNYINVYGTSYHGSRWGEIYKYYNAYFWKEFPKGGRNYEYVTKYNNQIEIEKDSLSTYNFIYEGGLMDQDYFFADVDLIKGKRWNMGMVNLDTIKPGKKVIILLHPGLWD